VITARQSGVPTAVLAEATDAEFVEDTDSNSPGVWDIVDGRRVLYVLNSHSGRPALSAGRGVTNLMTVGPVAWRGSPPPGGVWMEGVVLDEGGTWYGYYHNEIGSPACSGSAKVSPRIGAARSRDRGLTWEDLGPIVEASVGPLTCATRNHYFLGGVGDFSVALDRQRQYLYFFYTQYLEPSGVGVSMARMPWAARDQPAGQMDVWQRGAWLAPEWYPLDDDAAATAQKGLWMFPMATPIHPAPNSWDDDQTGVDVFWGPSVHWNAFLQTWVMLLNRADSDDWDQEGVYISYNPAIDHPQGWSAPALLMKGGTWYPQVMGLEFGWGTDKTAGQSARFFLGGKSEKLILFSRP
jgi:hypothetical protein